MLNRDKNRESRGYVSNERLNEGQNGKGMNIQRRAERILWYIQRTTKRRVRRVHYVQQTTEWTETTNRKDPTANRNTSRLTKRA